MQPPEFKCPDCGSTALEERTKIYGADLDGNRGQRRKYAECQNCGWTGRPIEV